MSDKNITFFLGANTPKGFVSEFSQLYNPFDSWSMYILKGGPGTGKSGIMKRVAAKAEELGLYHENIICSSDPDSFDAVIIPEIKFAIADGTSPHTIEPKFPGAVEEIVNLGDCWNGEMLRARADKIREATLTCSELHRRSVRFLNAAASLQNDTVRLLQNSADKAKIENYAARFAAREFGSPKGRIGTEKRRYLSAPTPKGIYTCFETVEALAEKIVVIDDPYCAVSPMLLEILRSRAISLGFDVITCLNPFSGENEIVHLIIPEKSLAIFTSTPWHQSAFTPYRRINVKRFLQTDEIARYRSRISFNSKASAELLGEAVTILATTKKAHDLLESYYVPAMNFGKIDRKADAIIRALNLRAAMHFSGEN